LKVVLVKERNEQIFWNHVCVDPLDYYFFIVDMKQRRDKTKVFLALDDDSIEGLALLYGDYIVQLRGSREAVDVLMEKVEFDRAEVQCPLGCQDLVLRKYIAPSMAEMVLMQLRRGEENIQIRHEIARLLSEDAEEIAVILKEADPVWWGDVEAEGFRQSMETAVVLGIRQEGKIACVGSARLVDFASNIGIIATRKECRNRGYATSVTSALTEEILKTSPVAIIHVLSHNAPAIKVYSRVGFKPDKRYMFIKGEKPPLKKC
jgi:RimJ/RimL family protein N-acetyltransferase